MDEIEYRFVKGVGWVTGGKFVIVEHRGHRVKLELRQPEIGEMYFNIDYAGEGWEVDGLPGPCAIDHAKMHFCTGKHVNNYGGGGFKHITVTRL